MVSVQHANVEQKVQNDLGVARHVLTAEGPIGFEANNVAWQATNQLTHETSEITLPQMTVGGRWLGQNAKIDVASPVVDQVQKLIGSTCTVFQRMNEAGDMLRVCTNVEAGDGTRASGTYIPAVNPDGKPNPVVAQVLKGESYHGRAYVVNDWYITAYEPIRDAEDEVVGVLYVGVTQEHNPALRKRIMETVVGKTGYVYVLGGKADHRGQYIISANGERDGENIWEARDADGRPIIQSVVDKALPLKDGKCAFERYPWQNEGEAKPRWKVAAVGYFEPWDWVIGAGAYEDDFQQAISRVDAGLDNLMMWAVLGAIIGLVVCSCITWYVAGVITRPLIRTMQVIGKVARGDYSEKVSVKAQDEVGKMAASLNVCIDAVRDAMEEDGVFQAETILDANGLPILYTGSPLKDQEGNVVGGLEYVVDMSDQKKAEAVMRQIADYQRGEVEKLSETLSRVAEGDLAVRYEVAEADENTRDIQESFTAIAEATNATVESLAKARDVAEKIAEIASVTVEQAATAQEVTRGIESVSHVTEEAAAGSEEMASSSEQLGAQSVALRDLVSQFTTNQSSMTPVQEQDDVAVESD